MEKFEINAKLRENKGTGASRRLRSQGLVPAIMYGAGKPPVALVLGHNDLLRHLENEGFYSHVLTLHLDNQQEQVVLKDLQRHPWRSQIMHLDLQRVSETEKLIMHVPLHFINEDKCMGVKQGGGVVSHHLIEVEIRCLPKDLPEFIEVDLSPIQLNQIVHLSDLVLPAGVELVAFISGVEEHNLPVVSVHPLRAADAISGTEQAPQPE